MHILKKFLVQIQTLYFRNNLEGSNGQWVYIPSSTLDMYTHLAWPTGVQLLVFFCSSVPVVLFYTPGISRYRNMFLSGPHLCSIVEFICDLFVSRDEPLMS